MADTNNKHKPVMLLRGHTWTQTEMLSQSRRVASRKQQREYLEGERECHRGWTSAKKESWSKGVSADILKCLPVISMSGEQGCHFIVTVYLWSEKLPNCEPYFKSV